MAIVYTAKEKADIRFREWARDITRRGNEVEAKAPYRDQLLLQLAATTEPK